MQGFGGRQLQCGKWGREQSWFGRGNASAMCQQCLTVGKVALSRELSMTSTAAVVEAAAHLGTSAPVGSSVEWHAQWDIEPDAELRDNR